MGDRHTADSANSRSGATQDDELGSTWPSRVSVAPVDVRSLALSGLLLLALLYTVRWAKPFLLPVVTGLLLSFLMTPLVGAMSRWGLPRGLAAALVVLSLVAIIGGAVYATFEPANEWLGHAPRQLARIETKVRRAIRPVEQVGEAAAQVERLAKVAAPENQNDVKLTSGVSLSEWLFTSTQRLIASSAVVLALLFFLLASEDRFLRKLVRVLPRLEDKKRAVEIARQTQRDISVHLSTIALINVGLGVAIWGVMYLLEMPSPLLWGVMGAVLNFVPYLGAAAGMVIVSAVAFLTFDDVAHTLLVPIAYGAVTGLEGTLITPAVLGRRLSLNPVVIFVGILFWGWMWGIPGSLLAVPMLLVLKTFCDHVPALAAIGEFLGR